MSAASFPDSRRRSNVRTLCADHPIALGPAVASRSLGTAISTDAPHGQCPHFARTILVRISVCTEAGVEGAATERLKDRQEGIVEWP